MSANRKRRETPEEVKRRIGMVFITPTLKSHTLIGEGATVEKVDDLDTDEDES
jgi:hypothetical protein